MELRKDIYIKVLPFLWICTCLCACQKDYLKDDPADRENLIATGRYLAAGNAGDYSLIEDPDKSKWFEPGTPFRLLAYAKPYKTDGEAKFRFNKVAWDGETDGLKFINIDSEPDKWFGFYPVGDEVKGTDGLVSLDFYGFTYGKKVEDRSGYIVLDQDKKEGSGSEAAESSATTPLSELTRTESVDENGELKDLMIGKLPDQNIESAGKDASADTQSIIPFRHCFSLLHFLVAQQNKEDNPEAAEDKTAPVQSYFPGIYVTDVKVTNTYNSGAVHLENGKIKLLGSAAARTLAMTMPGTTESGKETTVKTDQVEVTTEQTEIGEMLIFPSSGENLADGSGKPDGYDIGLEITFKCPDEKTRQKFIDSFKWNDYQAYTIENKEDGYYMTIEKKKIMTVNSDGTEEVLRFRQNAEYFLVISFQNDMVRVITAVPTMEEWLPGEDENGEPWEEQAIGQPQMFDNILWSDRNLGAAHFDPHGENGKNFEYTIGYFYQSGRNIPYYPFDYTTGKTPDYYTMRNQIFADKPMKWQNTNYRFYPVVDPDVLKMTGSEKWTMTQQESSGIHPQMMIPEKKPEDKSYFDFMKGQADSGLSESQDMHWDLLQIHQPTSGAWKIPSSNDFLGIFPSTPFAGNITLRDGSNSWDPMNWGVNGDSHVEFSDSEPKTLRITVPFYKQGSKDADKPTNKSSAYQEAWQTLHDHEYGNEGTTHLEKYRLGWPNTDANLSFEPDGDPEDGFASVYVISGEPQDTVSLSNRLSDNFKITNWGTIYAIKRAYTPQAYRMRWRALIAKQGQYNPCIYIEICRYRCNADDHLNEDNYKTDYDWEHPASRLYFPVCGLGDWTGEFINFGTECQYATSDKISDDGKTGALHIKITGDNAANSYIAVLTKIINRNFAKQIRPIEGGEINE